MSSCSGPNGELLLILCPFMHVDGTHPGCELPEFLRRNDLTLRIGRDPKVMGMPDLELTADGFSATLSIQGYRHRAYVPWAAVRAIRISEPFEGPTIVWPTENQTQAETPKAKGLRLVQN